MTRLLVARSVAIGAAMLLLAGCSAPAPAPTPSATVAAPAPTGDGVLKIGTILPTSGTYAFIGAAQIAGVATAVKDINEAGGVNGVPVEHFVVMPPATVANVRRIFARGQELDRNPRAFSKLGDSISLTSHYFARFDQRRYNLGIYSALQPTIDTYDHSFERFGMAVRIGLLAWISFRPGVADPQLCRPEEHMVECELRLHNPSVLIIRLGTNDIAPGDAFERAIRHAIETSVAEGVIPLLATKSDRFEGDNRHNETLRALAAEYAVPLWDFDLVAGTLPDRGLGGDAVHLTMYASDDFSDPATLSFGYPLSDLTGLFALDAIRRATTETAE